jgi:tricorn protease-like protein
MYEGWIYILINPSLKKNMIKIGMTKRSPEIRAQELSVVTSIPSEFYVAYEAIASDCVLAEKMIHEKLGKYRVSENREFFNIPLKNAVSEVNDVIRRINSENRFYSDSINEKKNIYKVTNLYGHNYQILSLKFSKDDKYIVSGASNARVLIHNFENEQVEFKTHMHMGWVYAVDISPNNRFAIAGRTTNSPTDATIYVWDLVHNRLDFRIAFPTAALDLQLTNNGSRVVVGTSVKVFNEEIAKKFGGLISREDCYDYHGRIVIFDLNNKELIKTLEGHKGIVNTLDVSSDGRYLVSGSKDNSVRIWDIEEYVLLNELTGHSDHVETVSFSDDDNTIASAGFDTIIKLWDWRGNRIIRELRGHRDYIRRVKFTHNSGFVVSCSDDGTIKFWNINSGKVVHTIYGEKEQFHGLALSNNGKYLAVGDHQNAIQIWDIENTAS